jgi:hypothetical protein
MSRRVVLPVVLVSICFLVGSCSTLPSLTLSRKYAGHALNALERLFNFFESDATHLNLDGLYGLRIAQGQLTALNDQLTLPNNEHIALTDKQHIVSSLIEQIDRIANVSLLAIEREQSEYLHRFALVTSRPFIVEYKSRMINRTLIEHTQRNAHFDEEQSDRCFAELLGKIGRISSTTTLETDEHCLSRHNGNIEFKSMFNQCVMLEHHDIVLESRLSFDTSTIVVSYCEQYRLYSSRSKLIDRCCHATLLSVRRSLLCEYLR